jgi:predicted PurR-regulated permease PerM
MMPADIRMPFSVRFAPVVLEPSEPELTVAAAVPVRSGIARATLNVLRAMLVLALLYTAFFAKSFIIPIVLAAFVATCLTPLVNAAAPLMTRGISAALLVSSVLLGSGLAVSMLATPVQGWIEQAPTAARTIAPKLSGLIKRVETASRATDSLVALGQSSPPATAAKVEVAATSFSLWAALTNAPKVLAQVFSVVLLVFFFLLHGDALLRRSVELTPTLGTKKRVVAIVRAIQSDTARYLLTTATINACLGLATTLVLWMIGVPSPWAFGLLAATLNFIPYVGAAASTCVLLMFGLIHFDTLPMALLPAGAFLVLTTLEGQFIAPAILGKHLSLSPVAILLWLMLWGWLWGIPGVLLGVPMLMVLKIVCERFDSVRWLARALE